MACKHEVLCVHLFVGVQMGRGKLSGRRCEQQHLLAACWGQRELSAVPTQAGMQRFPALERNGLQAVWPCAALALPVCSPPSPPTVPAKGDEKTHHRQEDCYFKNVLYTK